MNINNKTKNFKNKILAILIGMILAFVCLEIFLQSTSFVITEVIKYKNHKQIKDKFKDVDTITILCIGESTTFRQYPIQLKEYLKKHSNKNFEIIDVGKPGTILLYINSKLRYYIEQYKPDIIITMMGINQASDMEEGNEQIYKKFKFKTLSLVYLLRKHIKSLFSSNIYAENVKYSNYLDIKNKIISLTDEFYEYNNNCKSLQEFDDYIEIFVLNVLNMLNIDESNLKIDDINHYINALELMVKYWKTKEYPISLFQMLRKNLNAEINKYILFYLFEVELKILPQNMIHSCTEEILKELINILESCKDINEVESYCEDMSYQIRELDVNVYRNYILQLYNFFLKKGVVNMEDFYLFLVENNIDVPKPKQIENVEKTDDITENKTYLTLNNDNIRRYYLEIVEKIINKNITYICMDYPTMPIQELKDFFKDTVYYDRIIFVSNEENFNKALKKYSYDKLFCDKFARTFGHCTDLGNTIIAENVGKVILDITNK